MKLSEAIRIGATKRPQKYGPPADWGNTKSCAVIAALEAITGTLNKAIRAYYRDDMNRTLFPLLDTRVDTPATSEPCCISEIRLEYAIFHLNDYHKMTREQIADWVEKIEAEEAASAEKENKGW